jgi:hypothetical protein
VKRVGWLLLVASACGPRGGLWLRFEAPLRVPDQCDQLQVDVWRGAEAGPSLFHASYALDASRPFPMTLALTTRDAADFDVADGMTVTGIALLGQTAVATGTGSTALQSGELTELDLQLTPSP